MDVAVVTRRECDLEATGELRLDEPERARLTRTTEVRATLVRPVEQADETERREDLLVERLARVVVADEDGEVVDLHGGKNRTIVLFCQGIPYT